MLMRLKGYHQLFQLIKKQQVEIHVQQWEPLRKFMIIYDYYMHELVDQFVQFIDIEITSQTIEQMVDRILEYPERTKLQILSSNCFWTKREHM